MVTMNTILEVSFAGLALSASPGPSMLYVLSRTVGQSRIAGLASAIGLCAGGIVLAFVAALGLSTVLANSPLAVRSLTIIGSGYLIYLGASQLFQTFYGKDFDVHIETVDRRGFAQIMAQGILVEVLNPKTILFFMLFISPFIDTTSGNIMFQSLLLGILVPLTAIPSDLAVVYFGSKAAQTVRDKPKIRNFSSGVAGLVLIGIGIGLFLG